MKKHRRQDEMQIACTEFMARYPESHFIIQWIPKKGNAATFASFDNTPSLIKVLRDVANFLEERESAEAFFNALQNSAGGRASL